MIILLIARHLNRLPRLHKHSYGSRQKIRISALKIYSEIHEIIFTNISLTVGCAPQVFLIQKRK